MNIEKYQVFGNPNLCNLVKRQTEKDFGETNTSITKKISLT